MDNIQIQLPLFVSTNSICQGRQVETLWSLVFQTGHEIIFAHTNFKWANLASHNAGVSVVIVGITNQAKKPRKIFSITEDSKTVVKETTNINAYLTSASNITVKSSSVPLFNMSEMSFGSMPNDGGYLLLSYLEASYAIANHSIESRFIRPFVGSQELIRGEERRCIWIDEKDYHQVEKNEWLNNRLRGVREARSSSRRETTQNLAETPYRFGEVRQKGNERIMVIPSVSSESREYLPVAFLPSGTIISNLAFFIANPPLWNMALIASKLHLIWVATVCGQLETRLRYSNTLGWNTFPIPTLTEKNKRDLTRCAEEILLAREAHFPATIADLYDPDKMPENLRQAHERNDEVLERIYIGRRFKNDSERLEKLFELYTQMTSPNFASESKKVSA